VKDFVGDVKTFLKDLNLYLVPVSPFLICQQLGILYEEDAYDGFDGLLIVTPTKQLIGVNSNIKDTGRKTFTCAHELGHYYYDCASFLCTNNDIGYVGPSIKDRKEIVANEFASELLMPRDLFLAEISGKSPSWPLIQELATKFKTSLQATANRFVKLSHHTCWLIIVKNKTVHRFCKADHNDFSPCVKVRFIPPKKTPSDWSVTFAESWFYENKKTTGKELLAWPISENQYGESLVLIWDKDNCLINDECHENEDDDMCEHFSRWK
jgi:Zn-dependent peptidase ImmA (M78 family)